MEPLISVLIPTFNRPLALLKAVKSVISQTYTNIEIIITDNSTNIETKMLMDDSFLNNPKINYYKNEQNIGPILNWRKALTLAQGEYCILLPDDDFFINSFYIEDAVNIMNREKTSLLLTACCFGFSDKNVSFSGSQSELLIKGTDFLLGFWGKYNVPTIANVFSKKIAIQVNAFNNNQILYSDIELWLKMASVTNISYYNIPSVYYSFHSENIVKNMSVTSLVENSIFINSITNAWQKNTLSRLCLEKAILKLTYRYCNFVCSLYKLNILYFSSQVITKTGSSFIKYYIVNLLDLLKYMIKGSIKYFLRFGKKIS